MLKNLGKKLTNNFFLKILAIFFAMILWLVVVNIDNPVSSKTFTTSITFENQDYITSSGKWFEALNGKNTATFRVSAQRTILDKMSNTDFTATADMERIESDADTNTYRVPVTVTANKNAGSITVTTKDIYVEVALDDLSNTQFKIEANTTGTVADGCAIGNVEIANANVVKVSGPASIVNQISSVSATINVDGMSTDITDNITPVYYDAEGNVVDTTKLSLSVNAVTITAQILNTKDVTLEFQTMGTPAIGYQLADITYSPTTVRIKGEPSVLNTIDKITIPAEVLDITDATETIDKTIDITSYLPNNVSLVLSADAKIDVVAEIEEVIVETFNVPVRNFTFEALSAGHKVTFPEDYNYVEVVVTGGKDEVEALEAGTITGIVNCNELRVGNHSIQAEMNLDTEVFSISNVYVDFIIEVSETDDTDSNSNNNTSNNTSNNNSNNDETDNSEPSDSNSDSESGEDNTSTESESAGNTTNRRSASNGN